MDVFGSIFLILTILSALIYWILLLKNIKYFNTVLKNERVFVRTRRILSVRWYHFLTSKIVSLVAENVDKNEKPKVLKVLIAASLHQGFRIVYLLFLLEKYFHISKLL